jgi:hypothetical protein
MIAAIAAQAAKGRLLLVATTDLTTGEPVIWDLGSIALHVSPTGILEPARDRHIGASEGSA